MLNLIDKLSDLDKKRIENYISLYGVRKENYIGNDTYLRDWSINKKNLYRLFGNQMIIEIPIRREKTKDEMVQTFEQYYAGTLGDCLMKIAKEIREARRASKERCYSNAYEDLVDCNFGCTAFIDNVLLKNIYAHYTIIGTDTKVYDLVVQGGTKISKALTKFINYYGVMDKCKDALEKLRIEHSKLLDDKIFKGTLCLSIHPLDFMTMSDNDNSWSSCMSWRANGCYHLGTLEMMNSNNVIVAYMKSSKDYNFDPKNYLNAPAEEVTWNNKKWRQMFYCTKEILVSGKAYPYVNKDLTCDILNILKDLAKSNKKWTYDYGIETYNDMCNIYNLARVENNQEWIKWKDTNKKNIIFHSHLMYNDMLNDSSTKYWCYRNAVKHNLVMSYSGKARCLCCNKDLREENDDNSPSCAEDSYNNRYINYKNPICPSCRSRNKKIAIRCDCCNKYITTAVPLYKIKDRVVCADCIGYEFHTCPDCNKVYESYNGQLTDAVVFRFKKDKALHYSRTNVLYGQKYGDPFADSYDDGDVTGAVYQACPDCVEKAKKKYSLIAQKTELIPTWHWIEPITAYVIDIDKDDSVVVKHSLKAINHIDKSLFERL